MTERVIDDPPARRALEARLAAEFDLPLDRAYARPPLAAEEAFGPSWRGYTVGMFGCLMDDGPPLELDHHGRSVGLVPYFAWQVFPPGATTGAQPLLTLRLHRVIVTLAGSQAYLEWRCRSGQQPTLDLRNVKSEPSPDAIAKLHRARRLFAGLQLGGRPPATGGVSIDALLNAIRACAIEAGSRPTRRDVAAYLFVSEDAARRAHRGAGLTWAATLVKALPG